MTENVSKNLTSKQRKAVDALVGGAKVKDAAIAAGVTPRTMARWRDQKGFTAEVQRLQVLTRRDSTTRLIGNADNMLDVLLSIAEDDETPPAVRVRASLGWLDHKHRSVEQTELEERIAALEEKLQ